LNVIDDYYQWLCELVDIEGHNNTSYWLLAKELFKYPFHWNIPHDHNREVDGLELRGIFLDYNEYDTYDIDDIPGECSILEMIIALSKRAEGLTEVNMLGWFWEIMENLSFDQLPDEYMYDHSDSEDPVWYIHKTLDRLVRRKYRSNGVGGMFPLEKTNKDQREVEIWYQMHAYMNENYPV